MVVKYSKEKGITVFQVVADSLNFVSAHRVMCYAIPWNIIPPNNNTMDIV